ncbi:uncharacterized protein LOC121514648 [Cheilinus undulatus]|uniref:uncharacterized protein LOC121514648 n=1 Tax=Cheilinus undulatus TaxID=241271 RepID=UPI001BD30E96|nr:uncharacterized protein LOC121514648 [Cheilinus undulatus]
MVSGCMVPGCPRTERSAEAGVAFYSLPVRDSELCQQWLRAANNPKYGDNTDKGTLDKLHICSLHFRPEDYDYYVSTDIVESTLGRNAVPSVGLNEEEPEFNFSPSKEVKQRHSRINIGARTCCVKNCHQRSHDHLGRKTGLSFYCFPAWRKNEGAQISALTMKRRAAWVAAVGHSHITFSHIPTSMRVCSRHFHSGKPAYEMLVSDPDWVPSLSLGHGEEKDQQRKRVNRPSKAVKTTKKTKKMSSGIFRPSTEGPEPGGRGGGGGGGVVSAPVTSNSLWREAKSLLHSILNPQTTTRPPADEISREAVHAGKEAVFRDFFRESLQASLEASSRSRMPLVQQATNTPPGTSTSSSSCVSCECLQRTVMVLQEELSQRTAGQANMEVPQVFDTTPIPSEPASPSPEMAQIEEEVPDWGEPFEGDEDGDVEFSPSSCKASRIKSKSPARLRFRKAWLSMFWFLRYSKTDNVMWCYVCRLHHDRRFANKGMIKGTKLYKVDAIKKHSYSQYHKINLDRFTKGMSD